MNNFQKYAYWISTGLLSALMLFSASMYFLSYPDVSDTFLRLGFPTFVIYPLAVAKILGLIAIWVRKPKWIMEWAYAGFFFDFLLALGGHMSDGDGEYAPAIGAIVFLFISYFTGKKVRD